MKQLMKKWCAIAGTSASLLLAATPAHAVYNIVYTESGGNVVATGSGSINTAGVSLSAISIGCVGGMGFIHPSHPTACLGTGSVGSYFSALTRPLNLGPGSQAPATSGSGQPVFLDVSTIYLPPGYTSGAALSNTATWAGKTLATLGVTVGTYTWSFGTGANADSVVLYVGTTPPSTVVPSPVTPPPIPGQVGQPPVPGLVSQLGVLDLSTGSGPAMTTCLLSTVKQMFGADASYLGQLPGGAAQVSVGGKSISFYPLSASTSTARGVGAFLRNDNSLDVGTSCGTFTVVPGIEDRADLGAALTSLGLNADLDANGVFTATVDGTLYAVRPDYFVTQGTATGTSSLQFGSDGLLRLTDKAGHVQILRAAFLNPAALQAAMGTALGGTLAIDTDGNGVFTRINGDQLALTPEMALSPAPAGLASPNWVNDRPGHYMYRIGAYYQGLTATPR